MKKITSIIAMIALALLFSTTAFAAKKDVKATILMIQKENKLIEESMTQYFDDLKKHYAADPNIQAKKASLDRMKESLDGDREIYSKEYQKLNLEEGDIEREMEKTRLDGERIKKNQAEYKNECIETSKYGYSDCEEIRTNINSAIERYNKRVNEENNNSKNNKIKQEKLRNVNEDLLLRSDDYDREYKKYLAEINPENIAKFKVRRDKLIERKKLWISSYINLVKTNEFKQFQQEAEAKCEDYNKQLIKYAGPESAIDEYARVAVYLQKNKKRTARPKKTQ